MDREYPLDTNAEADLADRECLANASALAGNDNTFETLGAFPSTLDDAHVHADGIPGTEVRDVIAQLCALDLIERIHGILQKKGGKAGLDNSKRRS